MKHLSKQAYEEKKKSDKAGWLGQVLRNFKGGDNLDEVLAEAKEKFEKTYPKYEGN